MRFILTAFVAVFLCLKSAGAADCGTVEQVRLSVGQYGFQEVAHYGESDVKRLLYVIGMVAPEAAHIHADMAVAYWADGSPMGAIVFYQNGCMTNGMWVSADIFVALLNEVSL